MWIKIQKHQAMMMMMMLIKNIDIFKKVQLYICISSNNQLSIKINKYMQAGT